MTKFSCPHSLCCSPSLLHQDIENPPIWLEVLEHFKKDSSLRPSLHIGPLKGWRHRAKLAVRGNDQAPIIGLFKEGSHEPFAIPCCQAHHPLINEAVELVRQWLVDSHIQPYQEGTGRGDLRYLQCVVERTSSKVQLSLVLNYPDWQHPCIQSIAQQLNELKNKGKNLWHSIWINFNSKATNTIFGDKWKLIFGEPLLWEYFGDAAICYQPASFAQANLPLFDEMLENIFELIPANSQIAEFYAGVGVIGLKICSKASWVKCVELNPHSEYCFNESRARLAIENQKKISFHTGPARSLIEHLEGADTLVVDPPRKGLDAFLIQSLNKYKSLQKIIYISCGWDSFKRDSQDLIQAGWNLSKLDGYLFFPGSPHIELLACFEKDINKNK